MAVTENKLSRKHLLDAMAQTAKGFIAQGHEHQAQIFLLLGSEREGYTVEHTAIIPMPAPTDHHAKDVVEAVLQQLVEPYDAYIFLSESWMVKIDKEQKEKIGGVIGHIKEQPDRIEVFMLQFVAKLGALESRSYEIKRDGPKPTLAEPEISEKPMVGRFSNLYDHARPDWEDVVFGDAVPPKEKGN